ncbi:MAG: alpha/beta hydrolase [Acidimicrobiia bacterium]
MSRHARCRPARPSSVALVVTILSALVAACAVTPAGAAGSGASGGSGGSSGAAPTAKIAWKDCDDGFRCGTVAVPLDAADPTGATVDLAVIKRPARDRAAWRAAGRRALVLNPGGPGGSGVAFLRDAAGDFPDAVQDAYDLVSFDPRGVGLSDPIDCVDSLDPLYSERFSPRTDAERAALVAQFRTLTEGCTARSGALLGHISTRETAHDMDRLRAALGQERLDYVGYSYGTYLGALYAQDFPDRVGRFVLDGPVDPSLDGRETTLSQARGFERALTDFLAWCSGDSTCSFHHDGDSAAAYDALRAQVARDPVAAKDQPGRVLDETRFDTAVISLLYAGRPAWRMLERALTSTEEGNASTMLSTADSYEGRDATGHDDGALEAFWAITCLDGPVIGDAAATADLEAEAARVAPRLGPYIVNTSLACASWSVPPVAAPGRIAAPGTPPILVVGTTRDPATPYEQAKALARQLSKGVLLTVKGSQHTSFAAGNDCADRAVSRFLLTGRTPPAGTTC